MTFIPFADLTAEQLTAAKARWDASTLAGYDYNFSKAGKPLTRRAKPGKPAKATKAAPAPKATAPATPADEVKKEKKTRSKKAGAPLVQILAANAPNRLGMTAIPASLAIIDEVDAHPIAPEDTARAAEIVAEMQAAPDALTFKASDVSAEPSPFSVGERPIAPRLAATLVLVPLACMVDSPTQPRTHYDQAEHEELTASMREHGWLSSFPALLRPLDGPAAVAAPVDPSAPEGAWRLVHPETRQEIALGTMEANRFTQAAAEELAASKYAKRYEIVFAHRRTRAGRSAGLADAPAEIRELSDVEVLELQLIENAQRSDLDPVEESEHLARLLALRDPQTGKPLHTKDTLAKRLGKTAEHVRTFATLCRLDGEAREAVAAGTISTAVGFALARIPDNETREKAAKEILNPTQGEGPMRQKAALDYIRRDCTRNLRTDAKFPTDDAELVPARYKIDEEAPENTVRYFGGDCISCRFNSASPESDPLRTGPRLGVCSNLACFDAKQAAGFERWRAENSQPERGRECVTAERNAEIFDPEGEVDWKSGLVPLNSTPDAGLLKTGAEVGEATWKDLTKGKLAKVLIARHPTTGKRVEVIDVEAAKAAAELNEHRIFKTSKTPRIPNTPQGDETHRAQTLDKKADQEQRRRVESEFLAEVAHKATAREHLPPDGWTHLCRWVAGIVTMPALETVAKRRGVEVSALAALATNGSTPEQIGLTCELVVADHYKAECIDLAAEFGAVFGIDLDAIRERVRTVAQPAPAPATAPTPAAPELALPAGENWRAIRYTRETKTDFDFNAENEATSPDALEILLPAPFNVFLHAACMIDSTGAEQWFAGFGIAAGPLNVLTPCKAQCTDGYPTRFTAFAIAARDVADRLDAEETAGPEVRAMMRSVAENMRDFAGAELYTQRQDETAGADIFGETPEPAETPAHEEAEPEPDPAPPEDVPTFLAVLYSVDSAPTVKPYDHAEYLASLDNSAVVWVCPIGGVQDLRAAELAAAEALQCSAGIVTNAGETIGFTFAGYNNQEAAE